MLLDRDWLIMILRKINNTLVNLLNEYEGFISVRWYRIIFLYKL